MVKIMRQRCEMICGNDAAGVECITANSNQVKCVTDMVVNQAYGISSVIDMMKEEEDPGTVLQYMEEIQTISSELINWAKYLQVTSDIRKLMAQLSPDGHDKRSQVRYPFPEEFREFVSIRLDAPVQAYASIINFSQSGIQFRYKGEAPLDSALVCTLLSHERIGKKVTFICEVKYFTDEEGEVIVGAQIVEVSDSPDFNFFMNVLDFMSESVMHDKDDGILKAS